MTGTDHERRTTTDERTGTDYVEGLVSVVLPTYERGAVVGDAIRSVLDQSYEDLELLVVDGGSTDRTQDVVESVSDPRLRYRRRERPAGVSAARNLGIDETDGEFVAFLDSDDRWRADKVERQVAALREAGPDCGVSYTSLRKDFAEPRTRSGASGDVEAAVRRMEVPTYTSTLLVRRRALDACGGFDTSLACFEDWDLCLRLAADNEFRYVAAPLVVKGTAGDHASADPDDLATAVRRLCRRYDLPDVTLARLYADVGVTYCEAGRFREGRPYLRAALRRDARRPKVAVAYLLSLLDSSTAFDAAMGRIYDLERRFAGA